MRVNRPALVRRQNAGWDLRSINPLYLFSAGLVLVVGLKWMFLAD